MNKTKRVMFKLNDGSTYRSEYICNLDDFMQAISSREFIEGYNHTNNYTRFNRLEFVNTINIISFWEE